MITLLLFFMFVACGASMDEQNKKKVRRHRHDRSRDWDSKAWYMESGTRAPWL